MTLITFTIYPVFSEISRYVYIYTYNVNDIQDLSGCWLWFGPKAQVDGPVGPGARVVDIYPKLWS